MSAGGLAAELTLWLHLAATLVLVLAIWTSTFAVQVPLHGRLARGFDSVTHRRLVLTNWARTAGWSVRGVLALLMTASVI